MTTKLVALVLFCQSWSTGSNCKLKRIVLLLLTSPLVAFLLHYGRLLRHRWGGAWCQYSVDTSHCASTELNCNFAAMARHMSCKNRLYPGSESMMGSALGSWNQRSSAVKCGCGITIAFNGLQIFPKCEFSDRLASRPTHRSKKPVYHKHGGTREMNSPNRICGCGLAWSHSAMQSVIISSALARICAFDMAPILLTPSTMMIACGIWSWVSNISTKQGGHLRALTPYQMNIPSLKKYLVQGICLCCVGILVSAYADGCRPVTISPALLQS